MQFGSLIAERDLLLVPLCISKLINREMQDASVSHVPRSIKLDAASRSIRYRIHKGDLIRSLREFSFDVRKHYSKVYKEY